MNYTAFSVKKMCIFANYKEHYLCDVMKRMENLACECYKKLNYLNDLCNIETSSEGAEHGEGSDRPVFPQENAVRIPELLQVNEFVSVYPDTQNSDLPQLFQQMSQVIKGIDDYETNVFSFWLMDMFLEGLKVAQEEELDHRNQEALIHWIVYLYNTLRGSETTLTRRDFFLKVKELLFGAEIHESESSIRIPSEKPFRRKSFLWKTPFPPKMNTNEDNTETDVLRNGQPSLVECRTTTDLSEQDDVHCMEVILDILYQIFAPLWSFTLLQTSIFFTPKLEMVELPFMLHVPKTALKFENTAQVKSGRKASHRNSEDENKMRELNRNGCILPLQVAEGIDILLKDLFSVYACETNITDKERGKTTERKKK